MRALILEDNQSLAQSLKELMVAEGWQVEISHTWASAGPLIDKISFDFFVIDILLPDKKGFEILEILDQKKQHGAVKIALISGFFESASILAKIPNRFKAHCAFFKKPIDESCFLRFVRGTKKGATAPFEESPLFQYFFEKAVPSRALSFYFPPDKTFDSKELIPCLFLSHLKKFTGRLKVTIDSKNTAVITFFKGIIVKLSSTSKKSFFGNLLVKHGLLLGEDIHVILEEQKSNKCRMGDALVEKGLLNPYMLNFILKEQIKTRLSETISFPSFKIDIVEDPSLTSHQEMDVDFNETDFMEWLITSLKTELGKSFFQAFYLQIKDHFIKGCSSVDKISINHKQFLQDYHFFIQNLNKSAVIGDLIEASENKYDTLRLLYFGLLTKSIVLRYNKREEINDSKREALADFILEKDSKDLFVVLNLPYKAATAEAEKSYRQLVSVIHPDTLSNGASPSLRKKCEEAFFKVTQSYDILKDENKRNQYINVQQQEEWSDVMSQYNDGLSKIKKGEYHAGLKILLKIADNKQAPGQTCLYVLWARLKSRSAEYFIKNRTQAVEIKKAINAIPINLRATALFWYIKGLFYAKTEQYEQAENLLQRSLYMKSDFSSAKKELLFVQQKIKIKPAKKRNMFNLFIKKSG